jgi:hypothetical protein
MACRCPLCVHADLVLFMLSCIWPCHMLTFRYSGMSVTLCVAISSGLVMARVALVAVGASQVGGVYD